MLNTKQKKELRNQAMSLRPLIQIGKGGLSADLITNIENDLQAHELIKLTLLQSCELEPREAAIECASYTGSDVIQVIGRTFVLYKKRKDKKGN